MKNIDYDNLLESFPVAENRRDKKKDRRERLTQRNIVARKQERSERRMQRDDEDEYDC